jgi:hypothetical protein
MRPERDSRGRVPVRVAFATGAMVACLLTVPVSAGLAAPGASAQRAPAEGQQKTPPADAAPPGVGAKEQARPAPGWPVPSVEATESSDPDAAPGAVDGPPAEPVDTAASESSDAAPGEVKSADGPAELSRGTGDLAPGPPASADAPAEPAPSAAPASPTGAPDPMNGPDDRPDAPDPYTEPAPAELDLALTDTLAAPNGVGKKLAPRETSSPTIANPFTDGISARALRRADAWQAAPDLGPAPLFARQPRSVESGTQSVRHSARPRGEAAGRSRGGTPGHPNGRAPRSPNGAVCSSSSACAGGAGMVPEVAALGCLCALFVEWLLRADDSWRSHRLVSLRERPG